MISEESRDYGVMDVYNLMKGLKQDQLGRIFVNFGEPLSLASYVNPTITLKEASLKLDKDLVISHFNNAPVCLNMIVAALLLHQSNHKVILSRFIQNCVTLYIYCRRRNINTLMSLEPNKTAVERCLKGMGFSLKPLKQQGKKEDSEVVLEKLSDPKRLASLAYYANGLLQNVKVEAAISLTLKAHFSQSKEPYRVDSIPSHIMFYEQLLHSEFVDVDDQTLLEDRIHERLILFIAAGEFDLDKDSNSLVLKNNAIVNAADQKFSHTSFFANLASYLVDSYLIAIMTAQAISNGNYELKRYKLAENLSLAIVELHEETMITHLHSCSKETITQALDRMVHLGLLDQKSYTNQNGS